MKALHEYETPLTDAVTARSFDIADIMEHARDLERKLKQTTDELEFQKEAHQVFEQALKDAVQERDEANHKLAAIYDLVEGSADGASDATDYEHLCNRIVGTIKP